MRVKRIKGKKDYRRQVLCLNDRFSQISKAFESRIQVQSNNAELKKFSSQMNVHCSGIEQCTCYVCVCIRVCVFIYTYY